MVWDFIQHQLLGMKWLTVLIQKLLTACGLDVTTRIGGSLVFFLMDVIKISILLCVLIFIISYIQTFFPPEKSRKIMGRFGGVGARIMGALLGTVTPFCSCSSIPIFMGFTAAGLTSWSNLQFFDFISNGRFRKSCSFDEYIRLEGSSFIRPLWISDCSGRWNFN